jgi:hypothetical protein
MIDDNSLKNERQKRSAQVAHAFVRRVLPARIVAPAA